MVEYSNKVYALLLLLLLLLLLNIKSAYKCHYTNNFLIQSTTCDADMTKVIDSRSKILSYWHIDHVLLFTNIH